MWDLPGPGLEPVSPALAGGFFTIAPPRKPLDRAFGVMSKNSLTSFMLAHEVVCFTFNSQTHFGLVFV